MKRVRRMRMHLEGLGWFMVAVIIAKRVRGSDI